jgi:hypothetical protein
LLFLRFLIHLNISFCVMFLLILSFNKWTLFCSSFWVFSSFTSSETDELRFFEKIY